MAYAFVKEIVKELVYDCEEEASFFCDNSSFSQWQFR